MQVSASSQQSTPQGSVWVPGTQWASQESQTSDHASWKDNVHGKAKMVSNLSDTPCHTKLKDFLYIILPPHTGISAYSIFL